MDSAGNVGLFPSLALDAMGHPHVSYVDWTNKALKYAYHDGSGWVVQTVSGAGYISGSSNSLALDNQDRPHISYCAGEVGWSYCLELRYAWYDGTNWITETVDPGGTIDDGAASALALDATDTPHISYHAGGGLRYAFYDGAAWVTKTLQTGHTVGYGTSLALDSAGRPHISYLDLWDLMYTYYDGTAWVFEYLASIGEGDYTSLALDSADRPHIAFEVASDPYGAWLMYASYDGQAWHFEGVDWGDYGQYIGGGGSLVLDSQNHPHISYSCDGTTIRYAHHDGTAWWIETVDTVGPPSTSLALGTSGQPQIVYGGGDLRYAKRLCTPVGGASIKGSARLPVGVTAFYTATAGPLDATPPVTITWADGSSNPTAAYSWTVAGIATLTVTATNPCGLGRGALAVTVCLPLDGVGIEGPPLLFVGQAGVYQATARPITATPPFSYTWDNGTVGSTTTYSWATTGTHTLMVTAGNDCGSTAVATRLVQVVAWPYQSYLPLVRRE